MIKYQIQVLKYDSYLDFWYWDSPNRGPPVLVIMRSLPSPLLSLRYVVRTVNVAGGQAVIPKSKDTRETPRAGKAHPALI